MPSLICPSCRHPIDFDPSQTGEFVVCPNCGRGARAVDAGAPPVAAPSVGDVDGAEQAAPAADPPQARVTITWTCSICGTANEEATYRCARCGASRAVDLTPAARTDGLAVASFVLSLIGCVPIIPQALAVTFGALSLRRIRRASGRLTGAGLAWAGVLLGLALGAIWLALAVPMIATGQWSYSFARSWGGPVGVPPGAGPMTIQDEGDEDENAFAEVKEGIEGLSSSLNYYLSDFKRLPGSLEDLVPSYAQADDLVYADGARTDCRFHYVAGLDPKRDDPNSIVVYTEPLVRPPPDSGAYGWAGDPRQQRLWKKGQAPPAEKRMVLMLNQETELPTLTEFDRRLQRQRGRTGATEPATPSPGGNTRQD